MQFIRELLEEKPADIGIRAFVTHARKLPSPDPSDPAVYLYQVDVNGYLYSDIACTRDPSLQDLQTGDEVISHRPAPDTEGYPIFLLLSPVPEPEPKAVPDGKEETEVGTSDAVAVDDPELPAFDTEKKDAEREEDLVAA